MTRDCLHVAWSPCSQKERPGHPWNLRFHRTRKAIPLMMSGAQFASNYAQSYHDIL